MTVLSDKQILDGMRFGKVVIQPFDPKNLSTSSYDVRLGEWFYREQTATKFNGNVFNIYDSNDVARIWGKAQKAQSAAEECVADGKTIKATDRVIVLAPGETILAHTEEFIGGRGNITTMMKARSSLGRSFITVCKCLHPDTLVRLVSGETKAIKDIKVGDTLINADRFGKIRAAKVRKQWRNNKAKRVMTVRTKSGREVTLAATHLCRISTPEGVIIVEARDLRVGDAMPVAKHIPNLNGNQTSFKSSLQRAALVGYFVAEGHWSKYRLSFAKAESKLEQRNEIMQLMRSLYPTAPKPHEDKTQITYNSVEFAALFAEEFPEICQLAGSKRVPSEILNGSDEEIREFLRTYIMCDGHMNKRSAAVGIVSLSHDLVEDICYLAARLGAVPTRFKQLRGSSKKHSDYLLAAYFYGEDANILGNKNETLVSREWSVNVSTLLAKAKARLGLSVKEFEYDPSQGKGISRSRLKGIYEKHAVNAIKPYVNDLVWDEIESITLSPVLQSGFIDISLDVESEDDALFLLSNGLMTLNCAGWGDVGYTTRWTMEITNVSTKYHIPLVVGERIAQIVFFETGELQGGDYTTSGNYQQVSAEHDRANWSPDRMLPRTKRTEY